MTAAALLEAPSSYELLHVPQEVTVCSRLATLIKTSLITEFPVNNSPEANHLTPDEAADLLLSPGSPWERHIWSSPEARSLLEQAIRQGRRVTQLHLLSGLLTLNLPRQNISSLGGQMTSLSHLTSCSLASNELTEVRGGDLPRSLRSLQLYGNRLGDQLAALLTGCPPLQLLGLGRTRLTDDHLPELAALLSRNLASLRVLDLCDNTICDLSKITSLVTTATSIRSISLSGNPVFLASGFYQQFLCGAGRLRLLDGLEMTDAVLDDLKHQLQSTEEPEEPANQKKTGKKTPVKKSYRRPSPDLHPARFEPSLTCALIRISGAICLPFVPKDQWPGQELCVVFEWAGDRNCPAGLATSLSQAGNSSSDTWPDGLCPLEALLQEKSDVTALETPLEWHCVNLRALRDALLQPLRVEVVRREKWTPTKKGKKGKEKDSDKNGKTKKMGEEQKGKVGKMPNMHQVAGLMPEMDDRPPPEVSMGTLLLPLRALLRPAEPLLLQGTTSSAGTLATVTDTHWTEAILNIQEEKKERKASAKKKGKDDQANKNKRMSASVRSGSSRKKEKSPGPLIQCFFSIELYRKPMPKCGQNIVTHLPIDEFY